MLDPQAELKKLRLTKKSFGSPNEMLPNFFQGN
jgi:hypothetical protein